VAQPFILPLPPNLQLADSYIVRVTALDPTTGNTVSGVTVSNVALQVDNLSGVDLSSEMFKLVNPVLLRTTGG
jgi:hypothetical protein